MSSGSFPLRPSVAFSFRAARRRHARPAAWPRPWLRLLARMLLTLAGGLRRPRRAR
ncbi:MAG: hypothetical protein L6Q75_18905 [Burkholderiaceae bacterium]|nr:hypothetical protein [Burkholderiaceae bacterium]